ncbi:MAG: sigma-54 dependent transcriptional regulator [Candidatus Hydrogenedens sp.]|nr:sigma-54 dependent transcriptional regulator [Candidatus Hydrogenedens sp.]
MNKEMLFQIWKEVANHNRLDYFLLHTVTDIKKMLPSLEFIDICIFNKHLKTIEILTTPDNNIPHRTNHIKSNDDLLKTVHKCFEYKKVINAINKQIKIHINKMLMEFYEEDIFPYIFLGPLYYEKSLEGILIAIFRKNYPIEPRAEFILEQLLEPFSVALANHNRIIELDTYKRAEEAEKIKLLRKLGRDIFIDRIIGEDTGLKVVMERVNIVAKSDLPVLLLGETGTGKELIARAIHQRSNRVQGPIIRVNCGAIPPELIDSQLFGHEKGAFTGAIERHIGWFERADGGTLFLDEIGELPMHAQVRLLRILQDGWLERIGGKEPIHVDVRLITATNSDLSQKVAKKEFREDLFYRIATFPIVLPPLRERKEDIDEMARYFSEKSAQRFSLPIVYPSEEDINLLKQYSWPGNVRELGAVIDRAVILGNGKKLEIARALGLSNIEYPTQIPTDNTTNSEILPLNDYIKKYIEAVLIRTKGKIDGKDGCAEILKINSNTLRAKMKKLGINWKQYKNK